MFYKQTLEVRKILSSSEALALLVQHSFLAVVKTTLYSAVIWLFMICNNKYNKGRDTATINLRNVMAEEGPNESMLPPSL